MKQKTTTSPSKKNYIIGIQAFHPHTSVKKGVKYNEGTSAGGFTIPFIGSEEEARKLANKEWQQSYQGHMKQMWIREEGREIAWHQNFTIKQVKRNVFQKFWKKKLTQPFVFL